MLYDPSPYLEIKNPLKQKMDIIYGGCDDLIGNSKPAINRNNKLVRSSSSIGFARRDFETRNEYDPKIRNNPKEMKYFLIYGNKGIPLIYILFHHFTIFLTLINDKKVFKE